jgi:RNA polymerase sigma-70 factor (ECF subfamily)
LSGKTDKRETEQKTGRSEPLAKDHLVEVVTRAQGGDVAAFHHLFDAYGPKILNYLFRMTGSREMAEDLAQETFILAFKKLSALRDPSKFQSWIFRIAQNNVYQVFRGNKPQMVSIDEEKSQELSDVQKLATPSSGPEAEVLSDELQTVIQDAINALPEKYKTVFVLSAIQKLSYKEISKIMGRSLASIKSDIHRARVEVRDRIRSYIGENYELSKLQ